MTEHSRAVFLSYASQDAEAARRICEALRAGGVEVWFDKSELRGGEAWDRSIRQQIHDCALFIPIISRHTHERLEGYFRREWKLAVDRTHDMAEIKAFLVPVVIDSTTERDPATPEKFRELQWTRLPEGETPAAFIERIQGLLSPESAPAADPAASAVGAVAGSAPARWRPGVAYAAVAVVAALALGYLALERLTGSKPRAPVALSVAVLPLANESGDASQQYFSDGISEDLITALGQFPGLKVIGRTSSFQFRDLKEDSRSIGAKLGVSHLLEGSVRRSGDMIRVSTELIDTADGSMQWSERYDRPYKELFALQDEITRAVVGALRQKLLPGEYAAAQSERPPNGSLEAYNALLRGRYFHFRFTEADWRKAIDSYTEATQLDPRYALAWSWESRAWTALSANYLEGVQMRDAYAKAREAADRALSLAPELSNAHLARAYLVRNADFGWREAQAEFRRALELAPNDSEAKFGVGYELATFGELGPAIEMTRQALATEPLRATWYNFLSMYYLGLNQLADAEQAIRRAIELQPTAGDYHATRTAIEIQRRDAPAALAAALEDPDREQDGTLALARQIGGDRSAADAALRMLIEKDPNGTAYQIAQAYALRDDPKQTFEWLDRAWSNRESDIGNLLFDPFFLRYKDDPRFAAFCRKIGLPVPGASAGNST